MNELEQLQAIPMIQKQLEQLEKASTGTEKAERDSQPLGKWRDDRLCFLYGATKCHEKRLMEYQKAKEQCLRKSRQRKELTQTKELIKQLKKGSQYREAYDKTLFQAIIKQIIINPNELVFQLKNGLQLTERREKE
ncbi:hypothetical protein [Anaerotignum lactatifermentans]|uniref:hypothetical protein n=1 Tax=Anaerotignum lactatifermentans TaxID=160404 RepID=UPI001FAD3B15|nr:hypothetical protein [Anaerotignum lactatifermentans]